MSGRHLCAASRCLELLLAPGLCLACGCELGEADSLCAAAARALRRVPNPCQYCGQPNPVTGTVCPACRLNPPRWQKMIAPLQYRGMTRDYLLQLKHSEATHLARRLCRHTLEPFRQIWPRPAGVAAGTAAPRAPARTRLQPGR